MNEMLQEIKTIRCCINGNPGTSQCESLDCRWGIGLLVDIEYVKPKREKQTIKLCGNADCFDSKCYSELLVKHRVRDDQKLIIRTYKNDIGNLREVAQVKNNI